MIYAYPTFHRGIDDALADLAKSAQRSSQPVRWPHMPNR